MEEARQLVSSPPCAYACERAVQALTRAYLGCMMRIVLFCSRRCCRVGEGTDLAPRLVPGYYQVATGVTEINLIAEDTNQWGSDFGSEDPR
eukprot:1702371-Rhodomonas_salina.1